MNETILNQIDELVSRADTVKSTDFDSAEYKILCNDILVFAERTFGVASPEYRGLDLAIHSRPHGDDSWKRAFQRRCDEMHTALMVARHRVEYGQSQLITSASESEWFLEPGTPHSAYALLRQLLEDAKQKVLIVDPYVGKELLPALHNVQTGVTIRILTQQRHTPKDFAHELGLFNSQHGKAAEARFGADDFHDRFLIVDDRLFLSGASFKDLGKKASVVTEVQDTELKTSIINQLETRWNNAQPI